MRYCPKCGTANRDGSWFCNECGEELGTRTQVKCPHCGTVNPAQNVLCGECSGRLPPTTPPPADAAATPAIKGLSLPTKNPAGEQEDADDAPEPDDQTPAWLRELGTSISKKGSSDDAEPSEEPEEVPDWLRDLRASLPEEPEDGIELTEEADALPDWLTAPESTAAEAEIESDSSEPEPLEPQAFAAEAESGEEPHSAESEDDEVPGWMSRLVPTAAAAGASTDPPSTDEEETPGWLTRLVPGETEAAPKPAQNGDEDGEDKGSDQLDELQPADEKTEAEEALAEGKTALPETGGESAEWLAGLQLTGDEPEGEAEELTAHAEEGETPDWLADLHAADEDTEAEATRPTAEGEEGEIPDWLADLQATDEEAEAEEGEIPEWMAGLQPGGEGTEAETVLAATEIEEGEIPDWMAELEPADEEAEVAPPPPAVEIEEGEIPDWVAELRPTDEEMAAAAALSAIEIEGEQFPDRVSELEPPSEELPLAETLDLPGEGEIEPSEEEDGFKLPDAVEAALGPAVPVWLAELQTEAPEAAQSIIEENLVDGELPDWLVRSEIEPDEGLAPAEIPGWLLALKPSELREEGEEAEIPAPSISEGVEETGLLAGIQGVLPVEMLIAQPRAITAVEAPELAMEDSPPARLFADVVGRPPDATPKEIASPKADVLPAVARWIIYAILIVVVALPIIVGEPLLSRTIEPTAATVDMHGAIESLASSEPVLVAIDYDPTSSGEMDVIAQALIGHLMDQETRVVVVSLLPTGPATAQVMLDELAVERQAYAGSYGDQYANLGYLPGQAAGVRLLGLSLETALPRDFYGTPLSELPVMQGLETTKDFSLIVELAAAQDTLRWWIEQAGTPYDVPLGTGASAGVVPIARPYYETESRQLVGLVGGVPDAVTYEALANEPNGPTNNSAARLDSQLAGQIVFILVILAGNITYLSRRGTRRER